MRKRSHHARREDGFTLFELLVVIIIMAILAGIVIFAVGSTQASGIASSCNTDVKTFQTALEEYRADLNSYPAAGAGSVLTTTVTFAGTTYGPFLRQVASTQHYQIVTDNSGGVFVYPPAPAPIPGALTMDNPAWYVQNELNGQVSDPVSMNYATNPAICSDPNVVN
jgi:general secretion pathway protein G